MFCWQKKYIDSGGIWTHINANYVYKFHFKKCVPKLLFFFTIIMYILLSITIIYKYTPNYGILYILVCWDFSIKHWNRLIIILRNMRIWLTWHWFMNGSWIWLMNIWNYSSYSSSIVFRLNCRKSYRYLDIETVWNKYSWKSYKALVARSTKLSYWVIYIFLFF